MPTYVPRTNSNGMAGSPYYYSMNPYYLNGWGLPNCTCYAWGRWAEILGQAPPSSLGYGNAENWFPSTGSGLVKIPASDPNCIPKLGAIACWADGPYSGYGHVAVVEQIDPDGKIHTSNSGYNYLYFYMRSGYRSTNYGQASGYRFQGFIYLPDSYDPPPEPYPPYPPSKLDKPLWFYLKRKPF